MSSLYARRPGNCPSQAAHQHSITHDEGAACRLEQVSAVATTEDRHGRERCSAQGKAPLCSFGSLGSGRNDGDTSCFFVILVSAYYLVFVVERGENAWDDRSRSGPA